MNTVKNKHRIPPITFSAMNKKKWFQELKLPNSKISTPRSLLPLLAKNAYPNMSTLNHRNIISPIANAQSNLIRKPVPDHINNISLLFR